MISFCSSTQHWLCKSVCNPSSSSQRSAVSSANSGGEVAPKRNFSSLGRWGLDFNVRLETLHTFPEFEALGSEPILTASGLG